MDRGTPIGLSTAISAKTLQARMEWYDRCKVLKGKNIQPSNIFICNERRDNFSGKENQKLINAKPIINKC